MTALKSTKVKRALVAFKTNLRKLIILIHIKLCHIHEFQLKKREEYIMPDLAMQAVSKIRFCGTAEQQNKMSVCTNLIQEQG